MLVLPRAQGNRASTHPGPALAPMRAPVGRAYGRPMTISNASALPVSTSERARGAAFAGIAGAGITAVAGIVVQAVVQPGTDVSDDHWSYPWSSAAYVRFSLLSALAFALVLVGLIGFARSGAAGPGRLARWGLAGVLAGTALLAIAQLVSILVRHQATDDGGAKAVEAVFSVAAALSAVGLLIVGVQTLRAWRWTGWRRFTPLAAGVSAVVLIGLSPTKALPTGIALYGVGLLALSVAMLTARDA
jgi:hypothetical protein